MKRSRPDSPTGFNRSGDLIRKPKAPKTLKLIDWENTESALFSRQHLILLIFLFTILAVYLFRLWQLQVLNGATYRDVSENNRIRLEEIRAPRGLIYDRNGTPLVENRPAYHLMIVPEDVKDMDGTLEKLAALCGSDAEDFRKILKEKERERKFVPVRLMADLDRDCLARVEAQRLRLPGVFIQVEPKRSYKWNGTAAHLLGYLSEVSEDELKTERYAGYSAGEYVGKMGIEKAFEKYLHGLPGGRQVEVDALGRRLRLLDEVLPVPGRNIWLTIDLNLQRVAEECLDGLVGAIVAMDPGSGRVLALASSPTFDQEKFIRGLSREEWVQLSQDPLHPLLNRAIGSAYPPGSTYKPFVALAVLQEDLFRADQKVFCPGFLSFGNRRYRCWRHQGHGAVDLYQAIVQSCDVYFYTMGLKLGVDRIAHYARMFGLGEPTGLGIQPESGGLVPTSAWKKRVKGIPWQKGETLSIAIGQGFNLATPLQMTVAYAAIANGGTLWQPYVISRIEGNRLHGIEEFGGRVRRTIEIEDRYFTGIQDALRGVVQDRRGTAHAIETEGLEIAGKTGTAQVVRLPENVSRKMLENMAKGFERDHAWFIGYAPARNPEIVVGVLVEHGGHGSSVAAPLARKVIAAYLGTGQGDGNRPALDVSGAIPSAR